MRARLGIASERVSLLRTELKEFSFWRTGNEAMFRALVHSETRIGRERKIEIEV